MSKHDHIEAAVSGEEDLDEEVALLAAAGQTRVAWHAGDVLAARRWSLSVALLLMDYAEASGHPIWDRRTAVSPRRRAGHDAWCGAWHIARGGDEGTGWHVDDLLPLVARFLVDDLSVAA